MPMFSVNKNAQPNGDHEVHEDGNCEFGDIMKNPQNLGRFETCHGAVKEAKETFKQSNGCFFCCKPCHTQ